MAERAEKTMTRKLMTGRVAQVSWPEADGEGRVQRTVKPYAARPGRKTAPVIVLPSADASALWTGESIGRRLAEAAETLRRLPRVELRNRMTAWPDVAQDSARYWLGYGRELATARPAAPSPVAIREMDEVLGWLLLISAADRKLAWARASGFTWRKLESMDGRSRTTLQKRWRDILEGLAGHLNEKT